MTDAARATAAAEAGRAALDEADVEGEVDVVCGRNRGRCVEPLDDNA